MPKNKFIAQPKPARVPGEPNPDEVGEVYIPDYVMRDFNLPRKPPWGKSRTRWEGVLFPPNSAAP